MSPPSSISGSAPGKLGLFTNITTPQDAHERFVLQVYLGSKTLEFSAVKVKAMLTRCYLVTRLEEEDSEFSATQVNTN